MTPPKHPQPQGFDVQKRKDRRFKQWNKTRIWDLTELRDPNGHHAIDGFTYDLSIGGARIHAMESFDSGTLLRLQIELVRTGETLRVEGVVKWRREMAGSVYEMGVEFQHTSMVTVLGLMKNLHDARRPPVPPKDEPAGLGRS